MFVKSSFVAHVLFFSFVNAGLLSERSLSRDAYFMLCGTVLRPSLLMYNMEKKNIQLQGSSLCNWTVIEWFHLQSRFIVSKHFTLCTFCATKEHLDTANGSTCLFKEWHLAVSSCNVKRAENKVIDCHGHTVRLFISKMFENIHTASQSVYAITWRN